MTASPAKPDNRSPLTAAAAQEPRCRLCTCKLSAEPEDGDDLEHEVCASCQGRPEARRLGFAVAPVQPRRPHTVVAANSGKSARDFTPAEKSLISKMCAFTAPQQLLDLCNERLKCDLGPDAAPYTLDQLTDEIRKYAPAAPTGGHDWASLRKLLSQARCSGLLGNINEQVIDDFAVLFSLNPKQVMALKDILIERGDGE